MTVGMDRRSFLLALAAVPAALPLAAVPAQAQSVDATAIDAYLTGLRAAEGTFRQTNPNGATQSGRFYLAKPGRIRFEYDSPKGAMVVADGQWVAVFDPKSNRNPTRYPLASTPLSLLLRDGLSLREPGLVKGATREADGTTRITVVDPKNPNEGRLVLSFAADPIRLLGWEVVTKAGQTTRVAVTGLEAGKAPAASLFNIELATTNYR